MLFIILKCCATAWDLIDLKAKVVNPMKGKKIAAYYGCLLLRPSKVMAFDDPENPSIIEDFIRAIGADAGEVFHAQRMLRRIHRTGDRRPSAEKRVDAILASAQNAGAEVVDYRVPAVHVQSGRERDGSIGFR